MTTNPLQIYTKKDYDVKGNYSYSVYQIENGIVIGITRSTDETYINKTIDNLVDKGYVSVCYNPLNTGLCEKKI